MQLPLPLQVHAVLQTRPVYFGRPECGEQLLPLGYPLGRAVGGMRVNPMLEGVDGGNPGQYGDGALDLLVAGPPLFGFGAEKQRILLHRHQLHRHGSQLGGFGRQGFVGAELQIFGEEGVHRMASFVHHGLQILHRSGGIHENEGGAALHEGIVVAAGRLPLAGAEVEMPHLLHAVQAIAEKRIDVGKGGDAFLNEIGFIHEGLEGFSAGGFRLEIPGAQSRQAELSRALPIKAGLEGHHQAADGLMKVFAILFGIVEAPQLHKAIGCVTVETGMGGNGVPQGHQFAEQFLQPLLIFGASGADQSPHRFPLGAVGRLQQLRSLRQGVFLPGIGDGHGPDNRSIVALKLLLLGLQGDVFLPIQTNGPRHPLFVEQKSRVLKRW